MWCLNSRSHFGLLQAEVTLSVPVCRLVLPVKGTCSEDPTSKFEAAPSDAHQKKDPGTVQKGAVHCTSQKQYAGISTQLKRLVSPAAWRHCYAVCAAHDLGFQDLAKRVAQLEASHTVFTAAERSKVGSHPLSKPP